MSNHLTSKEIDNLVSGLSSDKDVKTAQEHLNSCPRCRMIIDTLSNVVVPHRTDAVPGEHVRDAVIAEWHRLHRESVKKEVTQKPWMKRIIAGFAFAASAVIVISAYIFLKGPEVERVYPLAIKSVTGEVYINGSIATAETGIAAGSLIKTGTGSSAVISSEDYNLYIGRSGIIEVSANSYKSGLRFKLIKGSVVSQSTGSLKYSFECAGYVIVPAGTQFLLNLADGNPEIAVSEGKVFVTGHGVHIEIVQGKKWSAGGSGEVEPLDEKTNALIKSAATGLWPDEVIPSADKIKIQVNKTAKPGEAIADKSEDKKEPGIEQKNITDEKKEKLERIKLKREIRNEISEVKKEQRKERKARNKD
jgi:hypothetical protein